MADLNDYCCTGRLTGDPELRYTQSGKAVAGFTLAVNGIKEEDTVFMKCTAWERLAEICNECLSKGSRVTARGRLRENKWESPEGEKRKTIELNLLEVVLPPKADGQSQASGQQQQRSQGQQQSRPQQPQRSPQQGRPPQGQRHQQRQASGQQQQRSQGQQPAGWGNDTGGDNGWGDDELSVDDIAF